jgi:hypothetical protein
MRLTRLERVLSIVGYTLIAVLAVPTVQAWLDYRDRASDAQITRVTAARSDAASAEVKSARFAREVPAGRSPSRRSRSSRWWQAGVSHGSS